ncbi:helix-turn-helix transcriptional regulator [Paraburkholderia sp. BCC1884]|uniref:helix-turn-helix transcriptional regulator n=1 Tax=Paraburkholderia sp. BCC1884 TaxID=2562668 RepID=UPI001182854C|nr:WYL domain-containing protein [Paraburkholderia sp. BCC1884]
MPQTADQTPSATNSDDLPQTVLQRLMHLERCLFWRGELQRADLIDAFGINPIQAAKDFRAYMERYPHNMEYNKSRRRYLPLPGFAPKLIEPKTLDEFAGISSPLVPVADWPLPNRRATPQVLLAMVAAVRERQKIEVQYQSMTGEKPTWRWLSPHAFASDGERWHVRAYCHSRDEFRDFVLGRILTTRHVKSSEINRSDDHDWATLVNVLVTPNPNLAPEKRQAIALEYDLPPKSMEATLSLRQSMLFYVKAKFHPEVNDVPAAHQLFVEQIR